MTDANTPEGTGETAWTVDEAAEHISGLLSDDPEEDTGAPEDNPEDDAEAEDVDASEAHEADEDETEAEDVEDDADEDDEPEMDGPLQFSEDLEVQLEDGSVVSLGELQKGNLRQADYTRKTQEVANVKRELEQKDQQITGVAQNLIQHGKVLEQLFAQTMPQRPTAQMAQEDPFGYQQAQALFFEHQERLQAAQQFVQQAAQQEEQRKSLEQQEKLQKAANELLSWNPDLADINKRRAFGEKLAASTAAYGFTLEDLNQITDVRVIKALADAAKYQELQKSKPKAVKKAQKAPPVTKPQQRQSEKGQMQRSKREQMKRLRKTGSLHDAAALLEGIIT